MCLAIFPAIFLHSINKNCKFLLSQVRHSQNQQVRRYLKCTVIWAYVLGTSDKNFCVNPTSSFFFKKFLNADKNFTFPDKNISKKRTIQPRILQKNPDISPHNVLILMGYCYFSSYFSPVFGQNCYCHKICLFWATET